jgi:ribosomal protein S13
MAQKGCILNLTDEGIIQPDVEQIEDADGMILLEVSGNNLGITDQPAMVLLEMSMEDVLIQYTTGHDFLVKANMDLTQLVQLPSYKGMRWKWSINPSHGVDVTEAVYKRGTLHMPFTN